MAKKNKKVAKLGSKKGAKYFVKDVADRKFTVEANGFDLELAAGEKKEVTKEVAKLIKEKFPYLQVSEV